MTSRETKKNKARSSIAPEPDNLANELKSVIKSLNDFLKRYFDRSTIDVKEYATLVKDFFICESTNSNYHCLIGSLFSKISNMLQPFIVQQQQPQQNSSFEEQLKEQISSLTYQNEKYAKKIKRVKEELKNYKETSNKLTNFIYMLRTNNIDIDSLYLHLTPLRKEENETQQEEPNCHTEEIKNKHFDISNFVTK